MDASTVHGAPSGADHVGPAPAPANVACGVSGVADATDGSCWAADPGVHTLSIGDAATRCNADATSGRNPGARKKMKKIPRQVENTQVRYWSWIYLYG